MTFLIAAMIAFAHLTTKLGARLVSTFRQAFGPAWVFPVATAAAFVALAIFNPELAIGAPLVGGVLAEGIRAGAFLLSEESGKRSRDTVTVTVPANTTYDAGLVLGKITASGKYVAYNNAAVDGSEVAAAILYGSLTNDTAGAVDSDGVIVNTDAEVRKAALGWNGQAQAAQDAGITDLAALGIKARN